ncbi:hypothetical protein ACWGH2_36290 [Streptomyces sp. NPDC054871]
MTYVAVVVVARRAGRLITLAVGGHFYEDAHGPVGMVGRFVCTRGGSLILLAARLGTCGLALTAPVWFTATAIERRRRWSLTAPAPPPVTGR